MRVSELPPTLAEALAERGYSELTPVQVAVAGPAALGRDLLVSSKTGSGKTVAYGLAVAEPCASLFPVSTAAPKCGQLLPESAAIRQDSVTAIRIQ